MSLPILVTPAAKPPQAKPSTPVAPADKPKFSQAIDAAERRSDLSKPADAKPEAAQAEPKAKDTAVASEKATEQEPQVESGEQAPKEETVAQAPVDVQMMVAVASQLVMPVAQANAQPVPQLVAESDAPRVALVETAAAAPVQEALTPAVPMVQQAVVEQTDAPQAPVTPQGMAVPVDLQAAVTPADQPESGEQQEPSEDSNSQPEKGSKPPVMPVATQQVPQSLESLRASDKVATLVNASPESSAASAPKAPVADAAKSAQEAVTAALVAEAAPNSDEAQPVTDAVRPWQLPHAVGGAEGQALQAQVIEDGAPAGETLPMREAMRMPFTQAAKEPGKPSELRLQLSPEYLGRMEIRVMSHEGTLSAQIKVDHAQAREMMQTQIAELRQSLADQGIKIDRLEVSVGQDKGRGEQSFAFGGNLQQQAGQQQQQAHQASSGRVSYYGPESFDEEGELVEGLPQAAVGATAVDYQA